MYHSLIHPSADGHLGLLQWPCWEIVFMALCWTSASLGSVNQTWVHVWFPLMGYLPTSTIWVMAEHRAALRRCRSFPLPSDTGAHRRQCRCPSASTFPFPCSPTSLALVCRSVPALKQAHLCHVSGFHVCVNTDVSLSLRLTSLRTTGSRFIHLQFN